jgi:hypothetical protein
MNQNSIQQKIRSRMNYGNAWYHLQQNLLSSSLLSKNIKFKIYRTIILGVFFYGCETCLLTLREERRLRVFENRVLKRIFWRKMDKVTGEWRNLYNEELYDLYFSPSTVYRIGGKNMLYYKLPVKDELLFYNPLFSM